MDRTKINLEYIFRASPAILYTFFTTPACLVRWFCDEVDITDSIFTFVWSGSEESAELVEDIEEERIRFHFEDYEEGEYLEFEMQRSPVTGETILTIVDYCDEDEVDDQKQLWDSQMKQLRQETGG
ncbi:MAG: START-like domain-containing protein [Bacteroidetes bacterium]|jgi:uncharacterized protein YndB with AHSA1/START domain|nr:START-like domain-containing protein [Bacteroidota bacterium]MDF1866910.1 START-like domain-containing protein [Saprospiraceae bacterium]